MSQPVKIAYLEISARMTGKTTRLCKLANDLSACGQSIIYVCLPQLAPGLRVDMPNVTVVADGQPVPETVDQASSIWFYDEFDWLKSTVVRPGGYYATSAARLRELDNYKPDDVLMQLVKANGNRVERHLWQFEHREFVQDHRAFMSDEHFRLCMLGEFLS
ncbi:hypothetical protein SRABI130_05745 [Pseudomonas sp. Bi130]|uniref:hypothetical protein n=1 Tax=Pseudomonas sp. Bi130 TaxID=2821122 RepID=UPI001D38BC16|nr:hypothetical protein [Pseudomonas sp. Bi130]CAH0322324.1 hypothetical protein SRABI130_05745 [Pseudomonas sp. Bi130]